MENEKRPLLRLPWLITNKSRTQPRDKLVGTYTQVLAIDLRIEVIRLSGTWKLAALTRFPTRQIDSKIPFPFRYRPERARSNFATRRLIAKSECEAEDKHMPGYFVCFTHFYMAPACKKELLFDVS